MNYFLFAWCYGLNDIAGGLLRDMQNGHNSLHSTVELLRQAVFGRLVGYDGLNDADRFSLDLVMWQVVGGSAVNAKAAPESQLDTEVLATSDNRRTLVDLSGQLIERDDVRKPPKWMIRDMDSSVRCFTPTP